MGVKGDVNKRCKEVGKNAPEGTVVTDKKIVFYTPDQLRNTNGRGIVVIEDIMASPNGPYTWCKPGTKPEDDIPMLGIDYWLKFVRFITTRMDMKPHRILLCADDRKYTPLEKIATQEKRVEQSKVETRLTLSPHDEANKHNIFTDDGICHPDYSSQDANGNYNYVALPPSICRASSALRKPLIRYFIKKLENWIRENYALFASSVQGIDFDFEGDHYLTFERHKPGSTSVMEWRPLPVGHTIYGEADGKIVQWADYYMDQYHIQVATIDTDLVSWSTGLVERHRSLGFKTCIHWINIDKSNEGKGKVILIELTSYMTYLISAFKFKRYRDLLVWTITGGGTDYWDKNWLTKHFGADDVAKAISNQDVSDAFDKITFTSWSSEYPDSVNSLGLHWYTVKDDIHKKEVDITLQAMLLMISKLDYGKITKATKTKPEKLSAKMIAKPTDSKRLEFLAERLWWHIGYCEMNQGIATKIIHERNNNANTTTKYFGGGGVSTTKTTRPPPLIHLHPNLDKKITYPLILSPPLLL